MKLTRPSAPGLLPMATPPAEPAGGSLSIPGAPTMQALATAASLRPGLATPLDTQQHGHAGRFKGALFQQGNHANLPRRGPIPRMPLRSPVGKRGVGRAKPAAVGGTEEHEIEHADEGILLEEHRRLQVWIAPQSGRDGNQPESEQGRGEERRFDRIFQASATYARPLDGKAIAGAQLAADAAHVKQAAAAVLEPLPPMHSLEDVVRVIHAATQDDPTGKSLAGLLRRINAAVLRNEIALPPVTRLAETRQALVDTFGSGRAHNPPGNDRLRALHSMLPLWLINLSKPRTNLERAQAAARLSLPRSLPHAR